MLADLFFGYTFTEHMNKSNLRFKTVCAESEQIT